jgi:hypothetical protein
MPAVWIRPEGNTDTRLPTLRLTAPAIGTSRVESWRHSTPYTSRAGQSSP